MSRIATKTNFWPTSDSNWTPEQQDVSNLPCGHSTGIPKTYLRCLKIRKYNPSKQFVFGTQKFWYMVN